MYAWATGSAPSTIDTMISRATRKNFTKMLAMAP